MLISVNWRLEFFCSPVISTVTWNPFPTSRAPSRSRSKSIAFLEEMKGARPQLTWPFSLIALELDWMALRSYTRMASFLVSTLFQVTGAKTNEKLRWKEERIVNTISKTYNKSTPGQCQCPIVFPIEFLLGVHHCNVRAFQKVLNGERVLKISYVDFSKVFSIALWTVK